MEELLSVRKTAETLGLRYGQVIRLIRSKKIKATKAEGGWGWMVHKKSVEAYQCKKQ